MSRLLRPLPMLACGLALGAVARLLDIHTQFLGELFSRMPVWILLGTLIATASPTPRRAAANILPFSLGMLLTYYAVAILTRGVYGRAFIVGWTVFALCSPLFAAVTWLCRRRGLLPCLLRLGIVACTLFSTLLLSGDLRTQDFVLLSAVVWVIFSAPRHQSLPPPGEGGICGANDG